MPRPRHVPPSRLYRSIAVGFSALVALLAATTLVLALSRAEIVITPAREEKELKSSFMVSATPEDTPDTIAGSITAETMTLAAASPITEGKLIEDRAHGVMTVINHYHRNQPLVTTTRFLSPDGVLFRSTRTITVPAGGRVDVEVRADQPGEKGEIGPSRFTIPGLWAGIQDKIYGESKAAMTGGERRVTTITAADLEKARAALAALQATTLHELNEKKEQPHMILSLEKLSESILTPAGSEADAARIEGAFTLTTVTYDPDALSAYLAQQVALRFDGTDRIAPASVSLAIERAAKSSALLTAIQKVSAAARAEDLALDPRLLKGKKTAEASRILEAVPGIGKVAIAIQPAFLKRLPRLPDHIKITIISGQ